MIQDLKIIVWLSVFGYRLSVVSKNCSKSSNHFQLSTFHSQLSTNQRLNFKHFNKQPVTLLYDLRSMVGDLHLFDDFLYPALFVNDKSSAHHTHVFTATHFPKEVLSTAHHWLILHGRYVCMARNPQCEKCGIRDICEFYCKLKKTDI